MRTKNTSFGFSLVELLIYVAVFSVSAVFLVTILTVVTQVQVRQASTQEVSQQLSFVKDTVQRLVQSSSFVGGDSGSATTTLRLRMASSTEDTTLVYASSSILYLETRDESGSVVSIIPLTDSNVTVDNFEVTKYEDPRSFAVIELGVTLSYNSTKPQANTTKSLNTAIGRISAAEFDSSVYPNADDSLDLGTAVKKWKDLYLAGNLGIGVTSFTSGYVLVVSGGDVGVQDAGDGVVLKTPDGLACYRISVTNSGSVTSTVVATCP